MLLAVACNGQLAQIPTVQNSQLKEQTKPIDPKNPNANNGCDINPKEENKIDYLIRCAIAKLKADQDKTNIAKRYSSNLIRIDDQARIQVYLYVKSADESFVQELKTKFNADVEITLSDLKLIQAWVPYQNIELLAESNNIDRIKPPEYGSLNH